MLRLVNKPPLTNSPRVGDFFFLLNAAKSQSALGWSDLGGGFHPHHVKGLTELQNLVDGFCS